MGTINKKLSIIYNSTPDKKLTSFPIEVTTYKQISVDKNIGAYDEWIVAANGFPIAMLLDETSMLSYVGYLKQFGFNRFPKKVMDLIRTGNK